MRARFKKKYSDRGIRKILQKYAKMAGIDGNISPQILRKFLITWLRQNKIDDALIQPYSGHQREESLNAYSKVGLNIGFDDAIEAYDELISKFPI